MRVSIAAAFKHVGTPATWPPAAQMQRGGTPTIKLFEMNTFNKPLITTIAGALICFSTLSAHDGEIHRSSQADDHAPISIMGDHTHKQNEWMISYRFMQMHMEGMRSGTDRLSANEVFAQGYTVTPEEMNMDMHMLGLMYAPSDQLTLMLMANYSEIEMKHRIYPGAPMMLINAVGGDTFTTRSNGWGDTKLMGLYTLYTKDERKLHATLGLSLPTGAINTKDRTPKPGMPPSFPEQQLPAPMQLGSGTYDLLPALTYVNQIDQFSYGLQSSAILRLEDENSHGYRLGHRFETAAWVSYLLDPSLSLSTGLRYRYDGKLKGEQENIGLMGPNGRSVTTAFDENYGGERVDVSFGLNYLFTSGILKGHRLAAEIHLPVWQDLNGLQLETDRTITIGWQKAF